MHEEVQVEYNQSVVSTEVMEEGWCWWRWWWWWWWWW